MITHKNFLDVFRAKGITDEELPGFLNLHFRSSGHRSETQEVFYPNASSPLVVLSYKDGLLHTVRAESGFADDDMGELSEAIYRDYIGAIGSGFAREVLFSSSKVKGTWGFRDWFLIRPMPSTAPQAPFSYAEHPFLLEYTYANTSNGHTNGTRSVGELRRLEFLLNGLLRTSIRSDRLRSRAELTNGWSRARIHLAADMSN